MGIFDILLDRILDVLKHGRYIMSSHLCEGPVPELLWIVLVVVVGVLESVRGTTVVSEPDIVASLVKLDGHRFTVLWRREPRVGRHTKARHHEHRLASCTMDRVVTDGAGEAEHSQNVAILSGSSVRLPIVFKLLDVVRESVIFLVVCLTGSMYSHSTDCGDSK